MSEIHIDLFVGTRRGERAYEPVHVTHVRDDIYRVLYTPGLVYGIAAEDEIRLLADGEFDVVRRAGNLAVRVYSEGAIEGWAEGFIGEVQHLGGRLDGRIRRGLAFAIPASVGFASIEALFGRFVSEHPSCHWEYGNVYDAAGKPLEWWLPREVARSPCARAPQRPIVGLVRTREHGVQPRVGRHDGAMNAARDRPDARAQRVASSLFLASNAQRPSLGSASLLVTFLWRDREKLLALAGRIPAAVHRVERLLAKATRQIRPYSHRSKRKLRNVALKAFRSRL